MPLDPIQQVEGLVKKIFNFSSFLHKFEWGHSYRLVNFGLR